MSVLAQEPMPSDAEAGAAALSVTVFDSLEAAEADWRAIEADGVLTPYQRYDWIKAAMDAGVEPTGRVAIAIVGTEGRPVAVLPLLVERRLGLATARLMGAHISNSDWLAMRRGFVPTPEQLAAIWAGIGREIGGLDLVSFFNQPQSWQGVANPILALGGDPAPNNFYFETIGPTPVPYIEHRLSQKKRSNIRRGARRLEESFGKLELRQANDVAELEKVHVAFLAQRGERFEQMGIGNVFAEPYFQRFFKLAAINGFGAERPALRFHALYAGDEIVATTCGTYGATHYSQYINSTSSGPAAKYSLMGVLVAELMDELTAAGILTFDMGIGDFEYKTDWTEPQPLYGSLIAVTLRGRVVASGLRSGQQAKRFVKQNPALWRLAQAARLALYRLRKLVGR
ncbi:MAG TPA: GNAT family N-acetyltransferase [Devosiaceae bacterium]|jgi:CelD/BcsL family acetyltransferase involved in cellulose biosynthesis